MVGLLWFAIPRRPGNVFGYSNRRALASIAFDHNGVSRRECLIATARDGRHQALRDGGLFRSELNAGKEWNAAGLLKEAPPAQRRHARSSS
jgi:hypothetical protein